MMKEALIINQSKGLHSKVAGKSIPYTEGGFQFLEEIVNIDVTDGYRLITRNGFSDIKIPGEAHSLFYSLGTAYGIFQDYLCKFTSFSTPVPLVLASSGNVMQYVAVNEKVYYSDGIINGVIANGWSTPWAPSSYVGPDTTVTYAAPPVATQMALHLGRIFLARGKVLWFTEALYYDGVNLTTDFIQFDSGITTVVSSETVLMVATGDKVYFLSGETPDVFRLSDALPITVVANTALVTENPIVLGNTLKGQVIFFTATDGIYVVKQDGVVFDITEDRLDLPTALTGNAYMDNGFYTVLIDE